MANAWAENATASLLTVEEGMSWLDRELQWTVQHSIASRSFVIPADMRYTDALALSITGYIPEARRVLAADEELLLTAIEHDRNSPDSWADALNHKAYCCLLFACRWLLYGERRPEFLTEAIAYMVNAERLSKADGLELGEDGYAELALLSVLTYNGSEAARFLPMASRRRVTLDPVSVMQGVPTRVKTLALAAHFQTNPSAFDREAVRVRIAKGIHAVMKEEFGGRGPTAPMVLPWLDLPNVLFGKQGDPWVMLTALGALDV